MPLKLPVSGPQSIGDTPNGNRRVVALGTGSRPPEAPVHDIFEEQ